MMKGDGQKRNIAILVDGENAQASKMEAILRETEKYGYVTIRRIYGDWTSQHMNSWKDYLHKFAFQPIQQFRYTTGKNSTDSALIIDAMDILHDRLVNGFSIVSSDSDYTRLATRIREEGFFIMGIGEEKTPEAFVKACEVFIKTEVFEKIKEKKDTKKPRNKTKEKEDRSKLLDKIREACDMAMDVDGWANLAYVGESLRKIDPGFDTRFYGFPQLSKMMEFYDEIEIFRNPNVPQEIKIRFREK